MKLYDISQEVFSCAVYPGDPQPKREVLCATDAGELYNLTAFSMCAHNGTHIDAPFHFLPEGKTVEQLPLDIFVGDCCLVRGTGDITAADAEAILQKASGAERILIAGPITVTAEAAAVFAASGIRLLGNEGQSVGPENAPMEVHKILLGGEVILLEGIRLGEVSEGEYFLFAAPINLGALEGAPCRAVLVDFEK